MFSNGHVVVVLFLFFTMLRLFVFFSFFKHSESIQCCTLSFCLTSLDTVWLMMRCLDTFEAASFEKAISMFTIGGNVNWTCFFFLCTFVNHPQFFSDSLFSLLIFCFLRNNGRELKTCQRQRNGALHVSQRQCRKQTRQPNLQRQNRSCRRCARARATACSRCRR